MFKIPLFTAKSLGFDRDMAAFSVKYGNLPNFLCKAVVDTGCPFTIISEVSIKRTRIPYNAKPSKYHVQLGNINMELKELGVCELNFRDENGDIRIFDQEVYVGIPVVKGYLAQELPSFIGKDFLNSHSLSIINKKEENSYLLSDS